MTERRVATQRTETASQGAPGNAASGIRSEVLSRAGAGSQAAIFAPETLSAPWPPTLAAQWQVELCSPFTRPADAVRSPAQRPAPRRAAPAAQNPHWQSILAVLATV